MKLLAINFGIGVLWDITLIQTIDYIQNPADIDTIRNYGSYGPTFGGGYDLHVCDKCGSSSNSYSSLGSTDRNHTGIAGNQVLTGACKFTVAEIEVFEVT
jgi:hypothetical protein